MREKSIKQRVKELEGLFPTPGPGIRSHFKPGESYSPGAGGKSPMKKGNRLAARENLTEEADAKRMAALFRTWQNKHRRANQGEKIMTHKAKKKASVTKRQRKRERYIMEQRQLMEEARRSAPNAIDKINKILDSASARDADKIAAAQVIFDRAYGKANQTNTNLNVDANGKPAEISDKELDERIESTLKRIEHLAGTQERAPEKEKSQDRPADIRERDGDPGSSTLH